MLNLNRKSLLLLLSTDASTSILWSRLNTMFRSFSSSGLPSHLSLQQRHQPLHRRGWEHRPMSSSSATTETQAASESDKAPKWAQEDGGVELMYLRATAAWSKIGQMCFESEMSPYSALVSGLRDSVPGSSYPHVQDMQHTCMLLFQGTALVLETPALQFHPRWEWKWESASSGHHHTPVAGCGCIWGGLWLWKH